MVIVMQHFKHINLICGLKMIGETFIIKNSNKKVKVLKQYSNIVLCIDLDVPTRIFWHKEIDNKYIVKISSLEKFETLKQTQKTLF